MRHTGRSNLIIFCMFSLLGLYISGYQSTVDRMAHELGMGLTLMGAVIAAHFIGSMATPPLMGRLSDIKGVKLALGIALGLIVLGLSILASARQTFAAAVGIFIAGCGFAAAEGLLTNALALTDQQDVEKAVGQSQMWFCLGAIAGPGVSSLLTRLPGGWRANAIAMTALFALTLMAIPLIKVDNTSIRKIESPLRLWRSPALFMLCLALAAYVGVEQGIAFFMGSHYKALGASDLAPIALSGYWAGMFIGRLVFSSLIRNRTRFAGITLALASIVVPPIVLAGASPMSIGLFAAAGFLLAATWPMLAATAAKRYEDQSGLATGYMLAAGAAGGVALPSLMGIISEHWGVKTAMIVVPVFVLFSLFMMARSSGANQTSRNNP